MVQTQLHAFSNRAARCLLLILSLSFSAPAFASAQSADEGALRALVFKFFTLHSEGDIAGAVSLWSSHSSDLEDGGVKIRSSLQSQGKIEPGRVSIRSIAVADQKADVRVTFDAGAKAGAAFSASPSKANRTFHFVKEDGVWKIWRYAPSEQELAVALVAIKAGEDRERLLSQEGELVTPELVKALADLGSQSYVKGDYVQSLDTNQLARKIGEMIGDKGGVVLALSAIGAVHFSQGDYAQSLQSYEQSLAIANELKNKAAIARALTGIGNAYFSQGKYEQAINSYRSSLSLHEEAGDKAEIARALNNLGNIQFAQGRYDQALEYYQRTLKLDEEMGEKAGVSRVLYNIGQVYYSQENYELALEHYRKSLALTKALGRKAGIASVLRSMGNIDYVRGNYRSALYNYRTSLSLSREMGDKPGSASSLTSIGLAYAAKGDYPRALDSYGQSLNILEGLGNKTEIGRVLTNMGVAAWLQGNRPLALELYEKALNSMEKSRSKAGIVSALRNLASARKSQGSYPEAMEIIRPGLGIAIELKDKALMADLLYVESGIQYSQRDYPAALEAVNHAFALAAQAGASELEWKALTLTGKIHRALNDPDRAADAFTKAIEAFDQWNQTYSGAPGQRLTIEARTSPYGAMVDLLISRGRVGEAFAWAERSKRQTLLDALQGGMSITKGMTGDERDEERSLAAQVLSLKAQISREGRLLSASENRLAELNERLEAATRRYEKFHNSLYARHTQLGVQRGEIANLTADEAISLIPNDKTALLEFAFSDEQAHLFVLSKSIQGARRSGGTTAIRVYSLPVGPKGLARLVEDFYAKLARHDTLYKDSARKLESLILGQARKQLEGKTALCIVPDGSLWDLPFQALMSKKDKYLIEEFAISYAPSLAAHREMMRSGDRSEKQKERYFQVSNPPSPSRAMPHAASTARPEKRLKLVGFDNPLPGGDSGVRLMLEGEDSTESSQGDEELKILSDLYGREQSEVYAGADATEERLKSEGLKCKVIHSATAGFIDDSSPMSSYILLSPAGEEADRDGILEASEVANLELAADMVILSASRRAQPTVEGRGLVGVSWAWFAAGCPTTITSDWRATSGGSTELMITFHRNLIAQTEKRAGMIFIPEQLRSAILKLLKIERYSHPFYWAGFRLMGKTTYH